MCAASVSASSPSSSFLQALSKPPLVSVPCSAGLPRAAVVGLPLDHPPVSVCESHIGAPAPGCVNCVPGLFVCHRHLVRCGGECFLCCPFCFKVQCFKHIYCECEVSVARRRFCAPRIAADAAGESREGSRVQRAVMRNTWRHHSLTGRNYLLLQPQAKQKQQEGEKRSEQPPPTCEWQKLHGAKPLLPKEQPKQLCGQPRQQHRPLSLAHKTGGGQQSPHNHSKCA